MDQERFLSRFACAGGENSFNTGDVHSLLQDHHEPLRNNKA